MSKKEYETMTCKQLLEVAKQKEVVGRHRMTKLELIEAILRAENPLLCVDRVLSAKGEEKIDNQKDVEVANENKNKHTNISHIDMAQKMTYVEKIEAGTLVAFRLPNGKIKSAKVTKRSTKNRKLRVETEYGAVFIVSFDDVVWVRTGLKWPRGVYRLLKGLDETNGQEQKIKA